MSAAPPRVVAIIPARGGSTRLPRKNIYPVLGKPLLAWTLSAALECPYIGAGSVFVSTEDDEIASVAKLYGAEVVRRPESLAGPNVWTEPVIQQALETIEAGGQAVDLVAWITPCLPELSAQDITAAIERLLQDDLREVISVDERLRSNSAIRVLRREALLQQRLSVVFGIMVLPYIDVHYAADIEAVEQRLAARGRVPAAESRSR